MSEVKDHIRGVMRRIRQTRAVPSSREIVAQAFANVGVVEGSASPETVVSHFGALLRGVWTETLAVLERHEHETYATGIPRGLAEEYPEKFAEAEKEVARKGFAAGVVQLFGSLYPQLRECFLSVAQGRKTRGGKDFELQEEGLLRMAEIPFEEQESEHRTDIMLPDSAMYHRDRNLLMVVSAKRTLRERWAEVAEELFNLRCPNVYLFTADENVSARHVERICGQYGIYLVVWDDLKARKFADESSVLGFTQWATGPLALFQERWRLALS